jgi:hypothetical protein
MCKADKVWSFNYEVGQGADNPLPLQTCKLRNVTQVCGLRRSLWNDGSNNKGLIVTG